MRSLELLAPARDAEIGIAAIDCGADAVYIAGPDFGARKAAGNRFEDIAALCSYAHRYGVRVFVTYNTLWREGEETLAHDQMLRAQEAGADAFIIREERIASWKDITVPLHASTQCTIRDIARARHFEALGCERIILERELSLEQVRAICAAVRCEVECFVHGALCVGYSGECRLSEYLDGRSADRGECIQACRSLYDLVDGDGQVLLHNKALLSLKDFNLKARLEELADAGVSSFKIEGRLKNASYVKNVVRDYSLALDALVAKHPDRYRRAAWGQVSGGFIPDTAKTFNRGYTELFLDGKRGKWSSMNAPKSMGEAIGTVLSPKREPDGRMQFQVKPLRPGLELRNGDGFAIATADGVTGFRGDVCEGRQVRCKDVPELREGMMLYRNLDTDFERLLERQRCIREIPANISLSLTEKGVAATAVTVDGRRAEASASAGGTAENAERMEQIFRAQLGKRSGVFNFTVTDIHCDGPRPFLPVSAINALRRQLAAQLEAQPCRSGAGREIPSSAKGEIPSSAKGLLGMTEGGYSRELLRSKYCIRYELGLCPRWQGARPPQELYLVNNGRRLALHFDCSACEMAVLAV